ncbi:hypothetical protein DUZ99_10550 [Xylanibacillus composti]|uniref:Uncharacterized protein n=1 Tax=Xylanibacillus composti TaxID=1572762 RepID=A0A8J4H5Q3_9BACL|nr:hypothetical protein [Xylanibacillus composti]MDT9725410.1 hypothetical protein [Xylanibacillus composti]GIQ71458.1 hypothetical protein XYCOK13_42820 [Xylanibacillus composti]
MEIIKFLLYMLFSMLEVVAVLTLIFTLFRIPKQYLRIHIFFVGAILAFVSHTIRIVEQLDSYAIIIIVILLFLFVWLMFRIQVFYAFIITISSYLIFGGLQILIIFSLTSINIVNVSSLNNDIVITHAMQLLTVIMVFLISKVLDHFHIGFDFVPHSDLGSVQLSKENLLLILAVVISLVAVHTYFYYFNSSGYSHGLIYMVVINLFAVALIIYLSIRRDKGSD